MNRNQNCLVFSSTASSIIHEGIHHSLIYHNIILLVMCMISIGNFCSATNICLKIGNGVSHSYVCVAKNNKEASVEGSSGVLVLFLSTTSTVLKQLTSQVIVHKTSFSSDMFSVWPFICQ